MRTWYIVVPAICLAAGCSLLFDGNDLHGTADAGIDQGVVNDMPTPDLRHVITKLSFAPKEDHALPDMPYSMALGDIYGEGRLDLAMAGAGGNVYVLRGQGQSFASSISGAIPTCPYPWAMALGKLDGNDTMDMVVGCSDGSDSGNVTVMLQSASGFTFSNTNVPLNNGLLSAVTIADVDHSGSPDIVVANADLTLGTDRVSILFNPGNGTFISPVDISVTTDTNDTDTTSNLVVADFDGDGVDDVVASYATDNLLRVFRGADSPALALRSQTITSVPGPYGMAAGPFLSSSTTPDLVLTSNENVMVLLNGDLMGARPTDAGVFKPGGTLVTGNASPFATAIADFNGDGKPDVAVGWNDAGNGVMGVDIFLGDGLGGLTKATTIMTDQVPGNLFAADLNGDGLADVIIADFNGSAVSVYLNSST
jgi:hypothetical protein